VYVADGFGQIVEGTLIGSNLGNAIAAHTHTRFVFDAGIRDQEENREIPNFNGFYRGYDPSAWANMELTSINAPIRIGLRIGCIAGGVEGRLSALGRSQRNAHSRIDENIIWRCELLQSEADLSARIAQFRVRGKNHQDFHFQLSHGLVVG